MFGGGGYDTANQFAGGGFMPSQADQGAGYGGGSTQKQARSQANQTLRAVTVRQLAQGVAQSDDDVVRVDDTEIQNVTVLGKVVSVSDSGSQLLVQLDDGTGTVEVRVWASEGDGSDVASRKAEWRPGTYVRAYGTVRSHEARGGSGRGIQAFTIRPITDYNEVTYHFLQCVFQHLHLTKGAAAGAGAARTPPGAGYGGAAPANQGGMWGGGGYGGAAPASAAVHVGGMEPCQAAVMEALQQAASDSGMHVNDIAARLAGRFNRGQVDAALQFLVNEAHAYTTIDDDHYRAAS